VQENQYLVKLLNCGFIPALMKPKFYNLLVYVLYTSSGALLYKERCISVIKRMKNFENAFFLFSNELKRSIDRSIDRDEITRKENEIKV